MKNIVITIPLLMITSILLAQQRQVSDTLEIATFKIVKLVFETKIISDAFGSNVLEGEQSLDGRQLNLYSLESHFTSTNLQVETHDGFYNFYVRYSENPSEQFKIISPKIAVLQKSNYINKSDTTKVKKKDIDRGITLDNQPLGEQSDGPFSATCDRVLMKSKNLYGAHDMSDGVYFYGDAIFIHDDKIYLVIGINNTTDISYEIRSFGFIILEKEGLFKKESSEDRPKVPTYIHHKIERVERGANARMVVVFNKFTLQKGEQLFIRFSEDHGQRDQYFTLNHSQVNKVKYLK